LGAVEVGLDYIGFHIAIKNYEYCASLVEADDNTINVLALNLTELDIQETPKEACLSDKLGVLFEEAENDPLITFDKRELSKLIRDGIEEGKALIPLFVIIINQMEQRLYSDGELESFVPDNYFYQHTIDQQEGTDPFSPSCYTNNFIINSTNTGSKVSVIVEEAVYFKPWYNKPDKLAKEVITGVGTIGTGVLGLWAALPVLGQVGSRYLSTVGRYLEPLSRYINPNRIPGFARAYNVASSYITRGAIYLRSGVTTLWQKMKDVISVQEPVYAGAATGNNSTAIVVTGNDAANAIEDTTGAAGNALNLLMSSDNPVPEGTSEINPENVEESSESEDESLYKWPEDIVERLKHANFKKAAQMLRGHIYTYGPAAELPSEPPPRPESERK
ncbi:MAG: hypothetical protein JXA66_07045, partial [Oligoflexia bacterium]|nr:hypothetical protein [Oligoflexia bacterium]